MTTRNAAVRDIIQLRPEHQRWPGCLAVISEVRVWGVIAYIQLPGPCEGITYVVDDLRAHLRLDWEQFIATGGRVPE